MRLASGPARTGEAARPSPFPPFTLYYKLQFARNIKAAGGSVPVGALVPDRGGATEERSGID